MKTKIDCSPAKKEFQISFLDPHTINPKALLDTWRAMPCQVVRHLPELAGKGDVPEHGVEQEWFDGLLKM